MNSRNLYPDIHDQQVTKMHEAVAAAESVTVEIGTGTRPLFNLRPRGTFNRKNLYIGINVESLQHKFLAEGVGRVGGFAVLTALGDNGMEPVPLPDGCANEVCMHNVFGEPDSPLIMHDFKHRDGKYTGHSSITAKTASLGEARRLLRPNGKLVVIETLTPYVPYTAGMMRTKPYAVVAGLVEDMGFSVAEAVDAHDDRWDEKIGQLLHPTYVDQWQSSRSYLVVGEKTAA